uniref:Uncharacterized protein n=1 Tax=Aegilops tauschii subsp. strangulata TaxID=200361 RepID=A0A453DC23_AEGTS
MTASIFFFLLLLSLPPLLPGAHPRLVRPHLGAHRLCARRQGQAAPLCHGRLQCGGLGGTVPATLVQVSLHHGGDD